MSADVTTLRKAIEETPGMVEVVCIEAYADADWGRYGMESWAGYGLPYVGPIEDAPEGLLDQEYDAGYGSPDRPMWTAWSATHVGFGVEYDGATGSGAVPRNPPVVGGVGDKERPANHSESMRHDPMCPMLGVGYEASTFCYCERLRERDARVRADDRERIAAAIEAQRIDLTGVIAPGELWIDGRLRRILSEAEYQMLNAVRDMDAAIARGGDQ